MNVKNAMKGVFERLQNQSDIQITYNFNIHNKIELLKREWGFEFVILDLSCRQPTVNLQNSRGKAFNLSVQLAYVLHMLDYNQGLCIQLLLDGVLKVNLLVFSLFQF